MFARLLKFLESEGDHDPAFIRLVRNILIFVMVTTAAILPLVTRLAGAEARNPIAFGALVFLLALEIIALIFVLRDNVLPAKIAIPVALVVATSIISVSSNGLRSTSTIALPGILVVSAILLGRPSLTLITPLAIAATVLVAARDITLRIVAEPIGFDDLIISSLLLAATATITHILIVRLNESAAHARRSEQAQKLENEELIALRANLEEKIRQRTQELEYANQVSEKRARQFKAVAQVMNAVSTVQSLDELLPLITRVISEHFGVYHAGVFLLDNDKKNAILRATNSEGGQRMLARKHSLPVGQTGIVGYVTATGQPRIALDVGADFVYFDNPDLPETHSEIALPLRYAGEIIGALDVQSTEPNAFQPDDVDVLSTLADQVAVAIKNALTIEEAQKSLAEAQSAVGQIAREAWQVLRPEKLGLGFFYSDSGVKSLQNEIENPQVTEALSRGKIVLGMGPGNRPRLAVPIRLRGQVVGVMQVSARSDQAITDDDADIAEAVAERLSLAIETATLLQSTQHRADLEKVTANITSKISSSTRFETVLQTAARELSRALGGSDVIVQIEPAAMQLSMDETL